MKFERIVKINNTVHRPAGKWTKQVHKFLTYIRQRGFVLAPNPLGFDKKTGDEIVSYIPGDVINYPLTANASSIDALKSAACLLRSYHDATLTFVELCNYDNKLWQLPVRLPVEIICHGDFAPYNVVLQGKKAVGIIDFDTCHPGPRSWDISYALYRWTPLTNPNNKDGFGSIDEQAIRATIFCDSYGLKKKERVGIPELIIARLESLVDFMHKEASHGNAIYKSNIQSGHDLLYKADIIYIKKYQSYIKDTLAREDLTNLCQI